MLRGPLAESSQLSAYACPSIRFAHSIGFNCLFISQME